MRIIVAGSRTFNDYQFMEKKLDQFLAGMKDPVIISGGARGADTLAIRYALNNGLKNEVYPADWNTYGKSAGFRRNELMSTKADMVIAFWDGKSKGTEHMINLMTKLNKKSVTVLYKENT